MDRTDWWDKQSLVIFFNHRSILSGSSTCNLTWRMHIITQTVTEFSHEVTRTTSGLHCEKICNRAVYSQVYSPMARPWQVGSCAQKVWRSWQTGSWGRTRQGGSRGPRWWTSWSRGPSHYDCGTQEPQEACCIQERLPKITHKYTLTNIWLGIWESEIVQTKFKPSTNGNTEMLPLSVFFFFLKRRHNPCAIQ